MRAYSYHGSFIVFILAAMVLLAGCIGGSSTTTKNSTGVSVDETGIVAGKAVLAGEDDNSGISIILESMDSTTTTMQAIERIPRQQRTPQLVEEVSEQPILGLTSKDGSFTITEVPAGKYLLTAQKLNYARATKPDVDVSASTVTTVDINMSIPGSINGKVYLESESDHSGIIVYLEGTSYITTTASDGTYTFSGVPAGSYTVVCKEYGFEPRKIENVLVAAEESTNNGEVVLPAISMLSNVGSLSATVLDKGLAPLANIYVYLKENNSFHTTTDATGNFKIDQIPSGVYTVVAAGNYVRKEEKNITVTGKHLTEMDDIILDTSTPKYGIISGSVSAGDYQINISLLENNVVLQQVETDEDGNFIIPAIVPGNYRISISSIGYVTYLHSTDITVIAGNTVTLNAITLEKAPGIISGTVKNQLSEPVENVKVSAGSGKEAYTMSDGSYFLSVPEGNYSLTFSILGYKSSYLSNIEVNSAQESADNDIVLQPVDLNSIVNEIDLPNKPTSLCVNTTRKEIYAACRDANTVYVINSDTFAVTASIETGLKPASVKTGPDGTMIYVCCEWENKVKVYSASSRALVKEIDLGTGRRPVDIVVSSGNIKYTANSGYDTISVINSDNIVVASFSVGKEPVKLLLDEVRQRLYCLNRDGGTVSIFNTVTNAVIKTTDIGSLPVDGLIAGSYLLCLNQGTNSFARFSLDSETVVENIKTGSQPEGIAATATAIYVTSYISGNIQEYSTSDYSVLATIPAGYNPTKSSICNNGKHLLILKPESKMIAVYLINR